MKKVDAIHAEFEEHANKLRVAGMDFRVPGDVELTMHNAAIKLEKAAVLLDLFANSIRTRRDENDKLRAELEAAKRDMTEMAGCSGKGWPCWACNGGCFEHESPGTRCIGEGFVWRGVCPANCGEQGAPFDEPMGGYGDDKNE